MRGASLPRPYTPSWFGAQVYWDSYLHTSLETMKKCTVQFLPHILRSTGLYMRDSTMFERRGKQYPLPPVVHVVVTLCTTFSKNNDLAVELILLSYIPILHFSVNATPFTKKKNSKTKQHRSTQRMLVRTNVRGTVSTVERLSQRQPSPFQDAAAPPDSSKYSGTSLQRGCRGTASVPASQVKLAFTKFRNPSHYVYLCSD
jgi:hypothetical protein